MTDRQARLIACAIIFLAGAVLCHHKYWFPGVVVAVVSGIMFAVDVLYSPREGP